MKNLHNIFKNHTYFQKAFFNSGWLMFENMFRMITGLIVGILVARHLGPKDFGILSYALSIITFLGTFTYLGLSGIVVREIVNNPEEKNEILGTTFFLKLFGGIFAFLVVSCIAFFIHKPSEIECWVLIIIGLSLFVRPFRTIEYWFHSKTQAKYKVIANSIAFVGSAVLQVFFVLIGVSIIYFAIASSFKFFLMAALLIIVYYIRGSSISEWRLQWSKAKELLSKSWIIILSGFLALINLKIDQIMLRWMVSDQEVGIYAVAARISEVWYFIPTAVAMSVFPKLLELKKSNNSKYNKRLQQILDIFFVVSFLLAILITIFANPVIPVLFGEKYISSAVILSIHIWAGIFMFMRALFSKWVFIEDALFFSLISHGSGAIANVILNIFLIPHLGGKGAATATLVSYAVSSYFFLFIYSKTRPLAGMMSKSFAFPFRVLIEGKKVWS